MIPLITDERRIIFLFCIPDLHDGRFILKLILYSGLKARRCSNTCWAWMFGMMAEPKLVILSVPVQNEKRYEFDVLAAAKDTVDGLTILDPKKNSGAILFGQLAPFYTRLKNELMDHIV